MTVGSQTRFSGGFSLIENLLSISILAAVIPVSLAALGAGMRAKEKSMLEYKSIEVAESIFSELPSAWSEAGGVLFAGSFDFPRFADAEEVSFLFAEDGEAFPVTKPDQVQTGRMAVASGCIATVTMDSESSHQGSEVFVVRVSGPAGRPASGREEYEFRRRFHAR